MDFTVKVDTGYHRAGVEHTSSTFATLVSRLLDKDVLACSTFQGLYRHAGHSYGGSTAQEAMTLLLEEVEGLRQASTRIRTSHAEMTHRPMILSVGATPTATSIEHVGHSQSLGSQQMEILSQHLKDITANNDVLEFHAGVYPFLDLQQLANQASQSASATNGRSSTSAQDMALTVLAEIASLYYDRDKPEALIAAGSWLLVVNLANHIRVGV